MSEVWENMTDLEKECREVQAFTRRKAIPRREDFKLYNITVGELRKRLEGLDDSIELEFNKTKKQCGSRKFRHSYQRFGYWDRSYLDMTWETLFGWIDD